METPNEYRRCNRLPLLLAGLAGTLLFVMIPVFLVLCLSGVVWFLALPVAVSAWLLFLACAGMSGSCRG